MSDEETSDVWDIDVIKEGTVRVCFEDDITLDEAKQRLVAEDYGDILDEKDFRVVGFPD